MTRAELNTFVDTNVTNKTTPNSLNPANEGGAIKAVADYVDERIILKKVVRTISSDELLDLFTTPIEIVPAVTGKLLVPQFLFQKYNHVSTAYTTSGLFRLGLGTITFGFSAFTPVITSADNSQGLNNFSYAQSGSGVEYQSLPIVLGALSANPASGDGALDLYLTYLEITL